MSDDFDLRRFMERADWVADAACRDEEPNLFFPNGNARPHDREQIRRAKAMCQRCDVQAECLAWAMTNGEQHGIWGGLDEDERDALRRADRQAFGQLHGPYPGRGLRPIDHGTLAGAAAHRRRGETPCARCLHAAAAYNEWRDRERGRTNHHARNAS